MLTVPGLFGAQEVRHCLTKRATHGLDSDLTTLFDIIIIWLHLISFAIRAPDLVPTSTTVTCQFALPSYWIEQTWNQQAWGNKCLSPEAFARAKQVGRHWENHNDLQMLHEVSSMYRSKTQSCWYVCMCFSWLHCAPAPDSRLVEQVGRVSKRACNQFQHRPYKSPASYKSVY